MDGTTMRTLREYIHELRRRGRDYNGTVEQPSFDTTVEDDTNWDQGRRSGDGGRGQDNPGQSGDNLCRRHSGTGQ
jgi:hypothetical protein